MNTTFRRRAQAPHEQGIVPLVLLVIVFMLVLVFNFESIPFFKEMRQQRIQEDYAKVYVQAGAARYFQMKDATAAGSSAVIRDSPRMVISYFTNRRLPAERGKIGEFAREEYDVREPAHLEKVKAWAMEYIYPSMKSNAVFAFNEGLQCDSLIIYGPVAGDAPLTAAAVVPLLGMSMNPNYHFDGRQMSPFEPADQAERHTEAMAKLRQIIAETGLKQVARQDM